MSYKPSNELIEYFAGQALGGLLLATKQPQHNGGIAETCRLLSTAAFDIGEAMAQEAMKRRAER